jgi:hypothetical protein
MSDLYHLKKALICQCQESTDRRRKEFPFDKSIPLFLS